MRGQLVIRRKCVGYQTRACDGRGAGIAAFCPRSRVAPTCGTAKQIDRGIQSICRQPMVVGLDKF